VKEITDVGVSVSFDSAVSFGTRSAKSRKDEAVMRRTLATIAILSVSPLIWCPVVAAQEKQQSAKQKKTPAKAAGSSLSGCVDQQDGQFVLINEESRSPIANLEADGFPTEGFAKHVGQKVTVRGTSVANGTERPVFRVRSVEKLSDTCGTYRH
jgi:hypothetical protein